MITFEILKLSFSGSVLRSHIHEQEQLHIEGIQVLTGDTVPDSPGILYIGTAAVVSSLIGRRGVSATLLVIAGDDPALDPLFSPESRAASEDEPAFRTLSLFSCSLSLEEACSRAFECCFAFNAWMDRLNALSRRTKDVKALLAEGAAKLKAPVFLLNSGYRLIASNVDCAFENKTIHQLLMDGYLSSESIDELTANHLLHPVSTGRQSGLTIYESILDTGHYALLCLLKYRTSVFGRLLVIASYGEDSAALRDYTKLLARVIEEHSLANNREQFESDTELSALVADLIDRKVSGEEELKNRLFRLPALLQPQYHCVLITFEPREDLIPVGRITHSLKKIFPMCSVAMYQDELIVLASGSDLPQEGGYDKEAFLTLLHRFGAYAAVGNPTKFLSSIRPTYLQCQTAIRLGRALSADPEQRIFSATDYMLPLLIDLCARYGYDFHENNLVYLCTPKYTALKRHDIEQGDNLCTILSTYIRSNCNTSQTARELFLHRNTVINKLDRIEEIIGGNLTDWNLRCQLMISSMVLDYAEKYRREDLLQVKEKYSGKPEPPSKSTSV